MKFLKNLFICLVINLSFLMLSAPIKTSTTNDEDLDSQIFTNTENIYARPSSCDDIISADQAKTLCRLLPRKVRNFLDDFTANSTTIQDLHNQFLIFEGPFEIDKTIVSLAIEKHYNLPHSLFSAKSLHDVSDIKKLFEAIKQKNYRFLITIDEISSLLPDNIDMLKAIFEEIDNLNGSSVFVILTLSGQFKHFPINIYRNYKDNAFEIPSYPLKQEPIFETLIKQYNIEGGINPISLPIIIAQTDDLTHQEINALFNYALNELDKDILLGIDFDEALNKILDHKDRVYIDKFIEQYQTLQASNDTDQVLFINQKFKKKFKKAKEKFIISIKRGHTSLANHLLKQLGLYFNLKPDVISYSDRKDITKALKEIIVQSRLISTDPVELFHAFLHFIQTGKDTSFSSFRAKIRKNITRLSHNAAYIINSFDIYNNHLKTNQPLPEEFDLFDEKKWKKLSINLTCCFMIKELWTLIPQSKLEEFNTLLTQYADVIGQFKEIMHEQLSNIQQSLSATEDSQKSKALTEFFEHFFQKIDKISCFTDYNQYKYFYDLTAQSQQALIY